jgi:hypothetical protein
MKWIALCLALAACSSAPHTPTDYDVLAKRPKPANDEARRQECSWIDTSLSREKKLADYVTATSIYPAAALAWQDATQRNSAVLQSRWQQIGCQSAAAAVPFEQCFQRCTQFTERGKEQCFDSCNK